MFAYVYQSCYSPRLGLMVRFGGSKMGYMLKAVIFDLDDTLIDWSKRSQDWQDYDRDHTQLVLDYLKSELDPFEAKGDLLESVRTLARQAWMDSERGLRAPSMRMVLSKALEEIGVPTNRINIDDALRAYNWQPIGGVEAFPDAVEVLPMLVSHGVKIGMITNAYQPMWMRDRELERYGLLGHFADCRLSAADVGYLKPHPAIFEAALQCLDAHFDEAVFIGDNPEADIAGAQSVGMRAVLRVGSKVPPMLSGLIVPDGAINTLHELLPLLDKWYPEWRGQRTAVQLTVENKGEANELTTGSPLS